MSEQKQIRYWYSARQVCADGQGSIKGGVRWDSGWAFGVDDESAKLSALNASKKTRELCPRGFNPDYSITGTTVEFNLVTEYNPEKPEDHKVIEFSVNL